jgi:hypothetical protein
VLPDTMVAGPELAPPTDDHRARIFGASESGARA